MHKKIPEICTGCRVSKAKIYLYHSTEIAKARPHSEDWQTDTSVQKQWSMVSPIDTELGEFFTKTAVCYSNQHYFSLNKVRLMKNIFILPR